jgi:predicted nuclease with RNAse H fold
MWIGADPGGSGCFGICLLYADGSAATANVSCADDAVVFVQDHLREKPEGAGVDAPLWWSSGPSGDRRADQWLRKRYGLADGEVQTANSLRGAALVQGVMFVARMREHYPGIPITESHPKALLKACCSGSWKSFAERFRVRCEPAGEHGRDAVIGAVAAREGFMGRWPNDLSEYRVAGEQDPKSYWLAPVSYYWPEH